MCSARATLCTESVDIRVRLVGSVGGVVGCGAMDDSKWLRYLKTHEPHIVGQFENGYGERFVIYRNRNGDRLYITGDELDWVTGIDLMGITARDDFVFSAAERDAVARILWPLFEEILPIRPVKAPRKRA